MKLGMIMGCEPKSFDEAKELGLDFVEFDLNNPGYWGPMMDDVLPIKEELKAASERTGIEVGAIGRWGSQIIAKDGSIDEWELNEVKKAIDLTQYLGAHHYLMSCNYVPEITYYQNITSAINMFKILVEYGKERDVTICAVNCQMGHNYIRTPEQWKLVLDEVPGLMIKYDPSHSFVHGGEKGAYMQEGLDWGDKFGYIHVKGVIQAGDSQEVETWKNFHLMRKYNQMANAISKETEEGKKFAELFAKLNDEIIGHGFNHRNYDNPPAGLDAIDWRGFMAILYKYGFDGHLSIEPHSPSWTGEKGDKGVKYTIKYMRDLMI
ncbi:MAG: sugar phosphate isomerase/epimerase [Clostridia bacterium]|nr:sugar phosphate isomerase/epimerase [Clostridia bacterium]